MVTGMPRLNVDVDVDVQIRTSRLYYTSHASKPIFIVYTMSYVETTAPIYKLDRDVLHAIFSINTHRKLALSTDDVVCADFKSSPLVITRRTSHVCVLWRDIVLKSPMIWARCVDLDELAQRDSSWRDLVLERAGNAMLTITATLVTPRLIPQSGMGTFFIDTLKLHWNRIREISISLTDSDVQDIRIMELFSRPAPNLQKFVLLIETGELDDDLAPQKLDGIRVFSDHAPSLVHFSCPELLYYSPTVTSPFLSSKMRHLDLQSSFNTTAVDLLSACLSMPLLETLKIRLSTLEPGDINPHELPRPLMTRLKSLRIRFVSFNVYPLFLDRITPGAGFSCKLQHDICDAMVEITTRQLEDMNYTLFRYASAFLAAHQDLTDIELFLDHNNFAFGCGHEDFVIDVFLLDDDAEHLPLALLTNLLDIVAELQFPIMVHQIDALYLDFCYKSRVAETSLEMPFILPRTMRTLNTMSWTTHLAIHHNAAIRCFHQIPLFYLLFPALTTLWIKDVPNNSNFDCQATVSYFGKRQQYRPLKLLKLDLEEKIEKVDMRFLNRFSGLTVAWIEPHGTTCHYFKCGVDDPERLLIG